MEQTIVINGKSYTKEELMELAHDFNTFLDNLREAFISLVKTAVKVISQIYRTFCKLIVKDKYSLGYKRVLKMEQLRGYENDSKGRSNNWRKAHGLHLRRNK